MMLFLDELQVYEMRLVLELKAENRVSNNWAAVVGNGIGERGAMDLHYDITIRRFDCPLLARLRMRGRQECDNTEAQCKHRGDGPPGSGHKSRSMRTVETYAAHEQFRS